jgi:hypothetical protein
MMTTTVHHLATLGLLESFRTNVAGTSLRLDNRRQ